MANYNKVAFLFFALMIFSYAPIFSQTLRSIDSVTTRHYTPFILDNAKWTDSWFGNWCQNDGAPVNGEGDTIYYTTSDTLIGSFYYKSLYSVYYNIELSCNNYVLSSMAWDSSLAGYLRQDTAAKKVFFLAKDSASEIVLYDFNLNVGDTIFSVFTNLFVVASIDSFQSNGIYYNRYNIKNSQLQWIEGFGSKGGLFNRFSYGGLAPVWLKCFSTNGATVYPQYDSLSCADAIINSVNQNINKDHYSIYPNPASNLCTLSLEGSNIAGTASFIDITGREVSTFKIKSSTTQIPISNLSAGLYFVKVINENGTIAVVKFLKE